MRFVQPIGMLLGALLYAVSFVFAEQLNAGPIPWDLVIFVGWNVLLPVVTVIAIVDAVLKIRAKKTRQLATDALVTKLTSIPFFLVNFVALLAVVLFSLGFLLFGGFLVLPFVPLFIGLTYLAMLSTSVYTWAAIIQLRRDGVVGIGLTILYALLSLIFVTDIAAGILLFGHSRGRPGRALVIVLLTLGLALAVPGFLLSDWLDPFLIMIDSPTDGPPWVGIAGLSVIAATIVGAVVWHIVRRLRQHRLRSEPEGPAHDGPFSLGS